MFDIDDYKKFVETKIVCISSRKDSLDKEEILAFCSQWDKSATVYFNRNCTRVLQRIFVDNIKNKPSGMSVNTFLLLEFGYKRCNVCANILELTNFSKSNKKTIGFQNACKTCVSKDRKDKAANINFLTAKRRAAKTYAQPVWITKEQKNQIKQLYIKARALTIDTGIQYHVDHIIPLQGKNVCGLHVPWNLQVITAVENQKKGVSYNGI